MLKRLTAIDKPFLIGALCGALAIVVLTVFLFPARSPAPPVRQEAEYVPEGDVVAFRRDCINGVLADKPVPAACASFETMRQAYGVDPQFLLDIEQGKMIMTARRIARGEIMTPRDLKTCINRGDCIEIPLIPAKYHGNEKVENSPQGMAVRKLFWHLVNDGGLTLQTCALIDICKAYVKLGLIRFEDEAGPAP